MTFRTCTFEREVAQSLKDGHWPEGCAPELRSHVEGCASCSDLVLVTQAFQSTRSESAHELPAVSPGLLWWRAQLRRRNAAAERISRPITVAQTFALVINVLVAAVFVASQYNHGLHWSAWWSGISFSRVFHSLSSGVGAFDWNLALLIPSLGVLALLGGVVVYLVSEKS